jgi:hypothetical protein
MMRWTAALLLAALLFPQAGCTKQQQQSGQAGANMASLGSGSGSAAGIHWPLPKRWTEQGQRPMRVATYSIPAADGDPEPAECAVFYFGNDQGGTVDQNIERWVSQFETSGVPSRSDKTVNGMKVSLVQVSGAYLAPAGPQMQSTGKKENYRLLGAIVQGPEGSVFFKFTGPARTAGNAEGEFNAMIESLAKL